jgi:hypothetical protein
MSPYVFPYLQTYLSLRNIIHRDVAARNVLMADNKTAKVFSSFFSRNNITPQNDEIREELSFDTEFVPNKIMRH